ncbi:FAD-binding protein [Porticoccaceae bacterium]|jgi:electron transfer flavoprotein alpha subunit|nr:FAD-binding protein [Porticoccaceae bacterium]MDB2383259.1 FAD-binding protein [Porticoccaceae bacterium]MDB2566780.1 FAD-binding protein [Porticoccaceae bacterium]MDB2621350.1 FAD-binding protein [Porticoccaceae bacterium]MDB3885006.1 FAD-binding protein [Porticoccaceae bacterium]
MSILIVAEHDNNDLNAATLNAVTAANAIGGDIHILVAGHSCVTVAEQASSVAGVAKVLLADASAYEHALAENVSLLIAQIGSEYGHILATATSNAKNIMPRAAALLDSQAISDISAVIDGDTFKRPIYAGNVIATVKSSDAIKVITVRGTAFDAASSEGGSASIDTLMEAHDAEKSSFTSEEVAKSDRPELTAADVVISGGRGMGNGENFGLLNGIADKLGAAIGASRAAVDAGFVPNDMQVGQTGKIVAPDLYIAVGISGAIQHLAGMKDSKVIVAINKDEEAPIFSVADYGLVADLFDALPEFEAAL